MQVTGCSSTGLGPGLRDRGERWLRRQCMVGWVAFALTPAALGQRLVHEAQSASGSWVGDAEVPGAELRVTGLALMVLLGQDWDPEAPELSSIRRGIQWMASQERGRGCIGLRGDPGWMLDHAIATYCLVEFARRVHAPNEGDGLLWRAIATLARNAQTQKAGEPGAQELLLWTWLCCRSLDLIAGQCPDAGCASNASCCVVEIRRSLGFLVAEARGPRDLAARAVMDVMERRRPMSGYTGRRISNGLALVEADPLLCLYEGVGAFWSGGADWAAWRQDVGSVIEGMWTNLYGLERKRMVGLHGETVVPGIEVCLAEQLLLLVNRQIAQLSFQVE